VIRRLAAALAALTLFAALVKPQPARAVWTTYNYPFCDAHYTQDELQYVSEPVLSVYTITFGQFGFFQITPAASTVWASNSASWSVDQRGFATVPITFKQKGYYLIFFEFTPFIFDDRYAEIDDGNVNKVLSDTFIPDGAYSPFVIQVQRDNKPVGPGVSVQFPGWSIDTNPYVSVTANDGTVTLLCVGKMRQVLPSPYKIPNLLPVFINDQTYGSYCNSITWGIDAQPPILAAVPVAPGGCSELPTSQAAANRRR
jgi:hypothetical protein